MPLGALFTGVVETAINKAIDAQPLRPNQLQALEGKRCIVFLDVFPTGLTFVFNQQVDVLTGPKTFAVATEEVDANTCIIKTKVSVLNQLKDSSQLTALIKQGELSLVGDITIAQQVSELAKESRLDVEEWLAQQTSDVFAHSAVSFAKSTHNTIMQKLSLLANQAAEVATEEKPIAARQQAVRHFNSEVGRLRDDVARLEARIQQLEQRCS